MIISQVTVDLELGRGLNITTDRRNGLVSGVRIISFSPETTGIVFSSREFDQFARLTALVAEINRDKVEP